MFASALSRCRRGVPGRPGPVKTKRSLCVSGQVNRLPARPGGVGRYLPRPRRALCNNNDYFIISRRRFLSVFFVVPIFVSTVVAVVAAYRQCVRIMRRRDKHPRASKHKNKRTEIIMKTKKIPEKIVSAAADARTI